MMSPETGVVIIGGGTAGTAAALELAERGVACHVLHQGSSQQPDHATLVPRSLMSTWWPAGEIRRGVDIDRLTLRAGHRQCTLDHADLTIVGQQQWSTGLRAAREAAAVVETAGHVTDVRAHPDGFELDVSAQRGSEVWRARQVIVATGPTPGEAGHVCGLWVGIQTVKLAQELRTPLILFPTADVGNQEVTPRTVSVTPSPEDSRLATMRIVRSLQFTPSDRFIGQTMAEVQRHLGKTQVAEAVGAIQVATFCRSCPADAGNSGQLIVGGAAGLMNPLTGEGIQFAATSGRLAAEAVAKHLDNPVHAQQQYRRQLNKALVGLGNGTQRSLHRENLTRRVLIDTIEDERPFFAKARRAILLPPGIGGLAPGKLGDRNSAARLLAPFTLACDEVVLNAVRHEWPLLASVLRQSHANAFELRPSSLFGLCYLAAGGRDLLRWSSLAAAIELSTLGALALLTSAGGRQPDPRQIDYHCAAATLAGDFLLARSSKIASGFGSAIAGSLSGWLEEIIGARLDGTSGAGMFAAIFEMPARLSASVASAEQGVVDELSSYGRNFGAALSHAEDILALLNRRTRLDTTLAGLIAADLSNVQASGHSTAGPQFRQHSLSQSLDAARVARGAFVTASIRALAVGLQADPRTALVAAAEALLSEDLEPDGSTSSPSNKTAEGSRALV